MAADNPRRQGRHEGHGPFRSPTFGAHVLRVESAFFPRLASPVWARGGEAGKKCSVVERDVSNLLWTVIHERGKEAFLAVTVRRASLIACCGNLKKISRRGLIFVFIEGVKRGVVRMMPA